MSGNENREHVPSNLAASGSTIAGLTGFSRLLGLVRDVVLANFFGASVLADAFFVAFRIPNFFRRLLAEGAFQQAFVPVLASYVEQRSQAELRHFIQAVSGNFLVVLTFLCVLGSLFAPQLATLFTAGAWMGDSRFELVSDLVRIMFPYLGLIAFVAFCGSILNTYGHFAIPASAPIVLNVCLIGAVLLAARFGVSGIYALAWGVLLAGVLQLTLHAPPLLRRKISLRPRLDWRDSGVRRMLRLIAPAVYAASAGQINILVGTVLAAQLIVGTVSWLYYADRLMELPVGVVAIALQTLLLPRLSRLFAQNDLAAFRNVMDWGMRIGLVLALPAAVALFLIAEPLIATIFKHGQFLAADVVMTVAALQVFALGLVPMVLTRVAAPGFFARQDTRTPFVFASIGVAANVGLSLALFQWIGLVGIAFATSLAAFANCYLLVRTLVFDGVYRPSPLFYRTAVRVVIGCCAMGAFLMLTNPGSDIWLESRITTRLGWLAALVFGGLVLYGLVLAALGVRPKHLVHGT